MQVVDTIAPLWMVREDVRRLESGENEQTDDLKLNVSLSRGKNWTKR